MRQTIPSLREMFSECDTLHDFVVKRELALNAALVKSEERANKERALRRQRDASTLMRPFKQASGRLYAPLGGKDFGKIFKIYGESGRVGVNDFLMAANIEPRMRADAYTALAKKLTSSSPDDCAHFAWQAWSEDPQPWRLKWLVFRLHDAGRILDAASFLDALPKDTKFNDKEKAKSELIRKKTQDLLSTETKRILETGRELASAKAENAKLARENEFLKKELDSLRAGTKAVPDNLLQALKNETGTLLDAFRKQVSNDIALITKKHEDTQRKLLEQGNLASLELEIRKKEYENILAQRDEARNHLSKLSETLLASLAEQGERLSFIQERASQSFLDSACQELLEKFNALDARLLEERDKTQNFIQQMTLSPESMEKVRDELAGKLIALDLRLQVERQDLEEKQRELMKKFVLEVMAINDVSAFMKGGRPGGLPVSKSDAPASWFFNLFLVEMLHSGNYDLVIEFGAGFSALLTAETIARRGNGEKRPKVIVFENQTNLYKRSRAMLRSLNLENSAELRLAPLNNIGSLYGSEYRFFDCERIMQNLSENYRNPEKRILVVAGKRTAMTDPDLLFPILPLCLRNFLPAAIDVLIDDAANKNVMTIIGKWENICRDMSLSCEIDASLNDEAILFKTRAEA